MPQIPTAENLSPPRVNGNARPAEINPLVAYDIGRAGTAMDHAMDQVAAAFSSLGEKQQTMDDQTWLSDAKIKTLQADDAIKRDTENNAGTDGTGYETAAPRLKGSIDDITKKSGGSPEARQKYNLWAAEQTYETGRWAANSAQKRLHDSTLTNLDSRLDTLSGLAAANPDRAEEYLKAYEEEVNGYVGSAITAPDAKLRIDAAHSTILKSSIITRAIKSPDDFGKALSALKAPTQPTLLDQAQQEYPILRNQGLNYKLNPSEGKGFLEFWPPNEPGEEGWKRPSEFPLDKPGLEVFDPKTRPIDILGDVVSHHLINTDPKVKDFYEKFVNSMTPKQEDILKDQYKYAQDNNNEKRSYEDWKKFSGIPAFFRGYAFDQWPKDFNDKVYTKDQIKLLDNMMNYLKKGGQQSGGSYDTTEAITSISTKLETGKTDPLQGVKNISRDARGSKSYGNFGLNSQGSAQEFQAQYGEQFGLTAKPGTPEFDKQWKNASGAMGVELHAAELEWWDKTIGSKVVTNLVRAGVNSDVANDPRVMAYFADRSVQYGPASIANHASRIKDAFDAAKGDPDTFLSYMSRADRQRVDSDFQSALAGGTASAKGLFKRINERDSMSRGMDATAGAGPAAGPPQSMDLSRLPKVDGSIQPSELYKLSSEDRSAVIKQLAPHLQVEMQDRMTKAIAAIGAKGTQDILTPEQIDNASPIIGEKNAAKWKEQLGDAKLVYDVATEARNMSREERYAKLRDLVPTGNPADLADTERKRYDIWRGVIADTEKQIKADPLKYLGQENESGRQAMKIIAGADPGAAGTPQRERAFDTLIELQKREGVSPGDVKLLGAEQADRIVKGMQDAKTGPAALVQLEGLRQTYGRHFDRIWGELVDHGAPQTFLSLRTATREGQDALVQSYAIERAMGEGKDTKKDLLRERVGAKVGDLQKAVSTKVADFLTALDRKESSGRLMEGYRSAVERTALYYMTQGKSLGEAVDKAADELYGKNLETYKGIIIPRATSDKLGSDLKNGIDFRTPDLIDPIQNQIVSNIHEAGIYPPGYERQRFLDSIKSSPRWVTNEDASGAYLLDERGMYVLHNAGRSIQPLQFTWDEFVDAYKKHPLAGSSRSLGID